MGFYHSRPVYANEPNIDYYIRLVLAMGTSVQFLAILITTVSLLVGLCTYARGMVDDLSIQMKQINDNLLRSKRNVSNQMDIIRNYVDGIRFHYRIIG